MEMIDFNAKKGFLCDMDGVIYHGNHILPGAAEFIHWLQDTHKKYLFLTNNSGMTPRELHQKLWRMGLDVPEEHFYTSALATAAFLADQAPGCSVYALGEAGLLNALYDRGITMNDVNPDYVVIGEARAYSLDTLTKATNLVLAGAKLIGANSDTCGPTDEGIAPACRALIAPVEIATGKQAYFCGKPNPLMMRTGLRMLGCHSGEAAMIGDRMDTDVISGMESGMATVLVLSGVSTRATLDEFGWRSRGEGIAERRCRITSEAGLAPSGSPAAQMLCERLRDRGAPQAFPAKGKAFQTHGRSPPKGENGKTPGAKAVPGGVISFEREHGV